MKIRGLIAAAGKSSRMDGFKPLMELNGFPMIRMTVQSLRNAGIRDVTVVVGCRAGEMREALAPMEVTVVENAAYGETDMFVSVRLGLAHIAGRGEADAVFFLPGDIPLVSPRSMETMKRRAFGAEKGTQVLLPRVGERAAHPPVILKEGIESVLRYGGDEGLRGAFAGMRTEEVELPEDAGALADADYRKEFEWLASYARLHRGVSERVCRELYEEVRLPAHVRRHCLAVGALAGWMAEKLVEHGACLDIELCRSGGYLHDLCRLLPEHEKAAGNFLRERGHEALAGIVEAHKGFGTEPETVCGESVLVCLADKLILEDRRVPLAVRYQKAFAHSPVKERILRDIRVCERLIKEFEVMTGERL